MLGILSICDTSWRALDGEEEEGRAHKGVGGAYKAQAMKLPLSSLVQIDLLRINLPDHRFCSPAGWCVGQAQQEGLTSRRLGLLAGLKRHAA